MFFAQGDKENLNFPNEYFDVVIALGLLEYLEDRDIAIKEIVRVVRKRSNILVTVPYKGCANYVAQKFFTPFVTNSFKFIKSLFGEQKEHETYPYDHRLFSRKELEYMRLAIFVLIKR